MKSKANVSKAEQDYLNAVSSTESFLTIGAITEKYLTMQESSERMGRLLNYFCFDPASKLANAEESVIKQMSVANIKALTFNKPGQNNPASLIKEMTLAGRAENKALQSRISKFDSNRSRMYQSTVLGKTQNNSKGVGRRVFPKGPTIPPFDLTREKRERTKDAHSHLDQSSNQ